MEQNLDRIFIRYQAGNLEYILGRQAVAFGAATISPTDVFTPVSFKALDQEYRPGVDAVRITGGFGDTTEIEGGIVAGKIFCRETTVLICVHIFYLEQSIYLQCWPVLNKIDYSA